MPMFINNQSRRAGHSRERTDCFAEVCCPRKSHLQISWPLTIRWWYWERLFFFTTPTCRATQSNLEPDSSKSQTRHFTLPPPWPEPAL
jgi:hypothetical protein